MNKLIIALIGNPNAGKTTLFNQLTGNRQRVGNWAGVTVERKEGDIQVGRRHITLIDLPGTYSLATPHAQTSPDEGIARDYLLARQADRLINVIDAANLERNLYLTLQLLELRIPCVLALNMLDIARRQRIFVDPAALSRRLGCPVIPLVADIGQGIAELKQAIVRPIGHPPPPPVEYPPAILAAAAVLASHPDSCAAGQPEPRTALHRLEQGENTGLRPDAAPRREERVRTELADGLSEDPALVIADCRYRAIDDICQSVASGRGETCLLTRRLDALALNRWLGIPCFLLVMYLMFVLAINVGGAFKPLFELGSAALFIDGVQWLGHLLHVPDRLTRLLAQGVGCGIGTLLPLIPQIGLMYLFLSLLEDTGYMARAAFVMDRLMRALGLPGKSFVPLIIGFGCNVPAVMATRTLDTARERLITMMMAPFMSCGARLAIFAVFAAAFFEHHGAALVFSLYLLGIATAVLTGLLLKATLLRGEAPPFIMELPTYHLPRLTNLLPQTWQRLKTFLLRAGKVIIAAGVMIGLLSGFTLRGAATDAIEQSALASVGRTLTPLLSPLGVRGDNWQATVGLMSGVLAKEVVIGALNQLYGAQAPAGAAFDPGQFDLTRRLGEALTETGRQLHALAVPTWLVNPIGASRGDAELTPGAMVALGEKFGGASAAYGYLIFVLLYMPCISVMGAIARESNRKWMLLSIVWSISIAYSLSALFYQAAILPEQPWTSSMAILLIMTVNGLMILTLYLLGRRLRDKATAAPACRPSSRMTCHQGGE
ncbi:Fe(2+) transporter permease subunit FeoB [Martelella alba]|uniref:Ferrous iron transport protein B n=1 Tax=Martelella alba TaxID=2590451 RepID=A0ABY2SI31_9HYPH|nr:Fe(2+) transporter permease subunit FeoB [Martelella alba]TKI05023.1 Fe(2+) transporter permease subunit FeoB [Martelella alba]